MSSTRLELEQRGPVAWVWLTRPDRRNALDAATLEDIAACFASLQTRFETRVVVLAGRGPSFCAGADRKDPPGARMGADDATARERRHASQLGRRALEAIEALDAVTIARLHGHAIGGGFALALACDFRVAAEGTVLSIPEVDLGLPLTWGAVPRLVRDVGALRARELILLCERLDAADALRWGLVNRVVPQERLDATVAELAERLAAKPEIAVHMTKTQLRAYAASAALGDVTESDGDLLFAASRTAAARKSFPG
jgi:enoyl-CoA hydratase/carnithine racemase